MKQKAQIRLAVLCVMAASAGFTVRAARLPLTFYTSADGLGSGFVDYIMRDSRGFMWFCTRDGLSRFDGSRFINYRAGDKDSPPGIEGMTETRDGSYWITTTRGLYRFKSDAVSQPEKTGVGRPVMNAEFIAERRGAITEGGNGEIWFTDD